MDWNGDGLNDLVTGQGSNAEASVHFHLNLGGGALSEPGTVYAGSDSLPILSGSGSANLQVTDYNNDGKYDLLIGMGESSNQDVPLLYINDPDTWTPPFNPDFTGPDTLTSCGEAIDHSPCSPFTGDLDGNGLPDLVSSSTSTLFFYYPGTGPAGSLDFGSEDTLTTAEGLINSWDVPHPCICDWDGDGDLDLLTGNSGFSSTPVSSDGVITHIYLFRNPRFSGVSPEEGNSLSVRAVSPCGENLRIIVAAHPYEEVELVICDLTGRTVAGRELFADENGSAEIQHSMAGNMPGLYLCRAVSSSGSAGTSFILLSD